MQTEITLYESQGEIEFEADTDYRSVDYARLQWKQSTHRTEVNFISKNLLVLLKSMRDVLTEEIKLLELRTTGKVTNDE